MENITGKKFNRLTAIKFSHVTKNYTYFWFFKCDCGAVKTIRSSCVKTGHTKSCGCLNIDTEKRTTHGKSDSKIYQTWVGMISRCKYKTHVGYKNYGGKGIKVCERWEKFSNFYNDMGDLPFKNAEIDRKDNTGNYEKSNCHWTTHTVNNRNRNNNKLIEFNSKKLCLSEWAETYNLKPATLAYRLNSDWNIKDALEKKLNYSKKSCIGGRR